jgi:DNA-binding GntR family transcriptional regulator
MAFARSRRTFHGFAWCEPEPDVLHSLFELRSIVEPLRAAALAATRRSQQQPGQHARSLDAMTHHIAAHRSRRSDLSDQGILQPPCLSSDRQSVHRFDDLTVVTGPPSTGSRSQASASRRHKRDPVPGPLAAVYDAIAAKDAEGARAAMNRTHSGLAIMGHADRQRPKQTAVRSLASLQLLDWRKGTAWLCRPGSRTSSMSIV